MEGDVTTEVAQQQLIEFVEVKISWGGGIDKRSKIPPLNLSLGFKRDAGIMM